uniref:NADH dehydrogenase subunit 6 n=1 Tax=Schistosoma indicum TaxID=216970 RepID=A0A6G9KAY6_9TREM|nr:NADH dehydrogenase subunit 6 [Schistosoma indicum]QIQ48873.1 NADH dehydrogenase subunit 6 [Schistosoma indicum]
MMLLIVNSLLFLVLVSFTFNSSPLFRSLLILLSSFLISIRIFLELGFSWYFVLFILVYIGGVYVILIYISMAFPNFSNFGVNTQYSFNLLAVFFMIYVYSSNYNSVLSQFEFEDCSFYLCNVSEILMYVFLCLVLMIGLVYINFVVSVVLVSNCR